MDNLATFQFIKPDAATNLRGDVTDMAQGSRNLIPRGLRQFKPFENLLPAGIGSRRLFPLRDGFGGLNDKTVDAVLRQGMGSLYSHIADSVWYCGQGEVSINAVPINGALASALLRVLLKWNGSYTDAKSGPFLVGLPEPSVPIVGTLDNPPGDTPQTNANYVFQYARISKIKGRSRASASTPILNVVGKGVYMVIPQPTSTTDAHVIFISERQSAGLGRTLRLSRANVYTRSEFTERDVQRTISGTVLPAFSVINSPNGNFTDGDVGKRVNILTPGYSLPAGTIVNSVNSPTQIILSNPVTAPDTATVDFELIAYASGIDRAVSLNWKESDLTAEHAWLYDFPPPPCSHSFPLGARIYLVCYADSATDAGASNSGTALIPSLHNQLESFDLRYPMYLPEKVVDVMPRMLSSYVFLGCRNGIYAVQETGLDIQPASISVVLQGEGIKTPHNWAFSKNALYAATADAKIIRVVGNGQVDTKFADSIAYLLKGVEQENIIISADPKNDGVVVSVKGRNVSYLLDEQTGRWSTELFLNDTYSGDVISALGTQGGMILTLESAGVHTLYEFDKGVATDTLTMSPYVAPSGDYQKVIQRIAAEYVTDKTDKTLWLSIHANNLQTHVRRASVFGQLVNSTDGEFSKEMIGSSVLIRGAGVGGAWYLGKIQDVSSEQNLMLAAPVPVNVTNKYMLIARNIFPIKVNRKGTHQLESPELFLNNLQSFAVSMLIETSGNEAQALLINIDGHVTGEQWFSKSNTWGIVAGAASTVYGEMTGE